MSKPSEKQIAFAKSMTRRQWSVLRRLADAPFYLSVTEHADPELSALMRNGLAQGFSAAPGMPGLWGWTATDQGRAVLKLHATGR